MQSIWEASLSRQDKEDVLDFQKQLNLLNLNVVETSTNAQDAQVESLVCRSMHEPDPLMHFFIISV